MSNLAEQSNQNGPQNSASDWSWLTDRLQDQDLQRQLGVSIWWQDPETMILKVSDKVGHVQFSDPDTGQLLNLVIQPKVAGSVAPMISRYRTIAFSRSRTRTTEGPDAMNSVSPSK